MKFNSFLAVILIVLVGILNADEKAGNRNNVEGLLTSASNEENGNSTDINGGNETSIDNDTISSNSSSSDSLNKAVTIEEEYDLNDYRSTKPSSNSSKSTTPNPSESHSTDLTTSSSRIETTTTKHSGIPRPPVFAGWWFFLGLIVAVLIVGLAYFGVRYFVQRRNNQYTSYQSN